MKRMIPLSALILFSLASLRPARAQLEKIGWEGGQISILAQLGNTLYGYSYYTFYKSTDWGKTWQQYNQHLPRNTKLGYIKTVVNGQQLLLDLSDGYNKSSDSSEFGVYYCKEIDSQFSFKKISLIKRIAPSILSWSSDSMFAQRRNNNNLTDSDDGLYFSTDAGSSWQLRLRLLKNDNLIFDHSIVYHRVNSNQLYRSKDFGISWSKLSIPTGDTIQFNFGSFDEKKLILQLFEFTNDTLPIFYLSKDAGETWVTPKIKVSQCNGFFNNSVGNTLFLSMPSGLEYLFFKSTDGGNNWERIIEDSLLQVRNVFGDNYRYVLATSFGNLITDTFFSKLTPIPSIGLLGAERKLVAVKDTKLVAAPLWSNDFFDSLYVSEDNGSTWTTKLFFDQNKIDGYQWVQDENKYYATGINKDSLPCIFMSSDFGITWQTVTSMSTKDRLLKIFVESDTIVARRENDFLISIDGGRSWVVITSPEVWNSVYLTYRDGVFLILPAYAGTIEYSTNFGNTWEIDNRLSSLFNNDNGIYIFGNRWLVNVGSEVFYRTDIDTVWKKAFGLPSTPYFPILDEKNILFATFLNNYNTQFSPDGFTLLFYSLDSGSSWKQLGDPVTNSNQVFIGSNYIFLGGPNELWRAPKSILSTLSVTATDSSCPPLPNFNLSATPSLFSGSTDIAFQLSAPGIMSLRIYDITGRLVRTLVDGQASGGWNHYIWNGRSDSGELLASGFYTCIASGMGKADFVKIELVR